MNKKYIVGGLIFWAGLSGYMGLRILESYTEDAVFAALSAVPAEAQEIRYSFLTNTLTLKGVEYELPDDKIMHKGSIERVEVTGFNRKCMFVKPDMPAYDPDTLPIVAESIHAEGIVDKLHFDQTQVEQRIADVQLLGWYQRLGMFLDQHRQHNGELSYYEELYRYRLDGLEVSNVAVTVTEPDMEPLNVNIDKLALSEGVRAPRSEEKVAPVSMYLSGVRFSGKDSSGEMISGGAQRLEVRDVLLPDPAVMVELSGINKALDAADLDTEAGSMEFENQLTRLVTVFQQNYEKKVPFSRMGMQGARLELTGGSAAAENAGKKMAAIALNGFDYTQALTAEGDVRSTASLNALKLDVPELNEDPIIARYAPEGFVLNMSGESVSGDDSIEGKGRYELKGLGELEGSLAILGDVKALQNWSGAGDVTPEELMQKLQLKNLNLVYRDSGLLAMVVELMARKDGRSPEDLLVEASQMLAMTSQVPNRAAQQLGTALTEQLSMPGEFAMALEPAAPISFLDLFTMVMMGSDNLPVTFSSKAGPKALKDYLPKN